MGLSRGGGLYPKSERGDFKINFFYNDLLKKKDYCLERNPSSLVQNLLLSKGKSKVATKLGDFSSKIFKQ